MGKFSPAELLASAKVNLGLDPTTPDTDTRVPKFYLDELRRHLMISPNEDKFCVMLQPNTGFGIVECLKDNCHEMIPLTQRRGRADDGGKRDGFGCLSAYRDHVRTHLNRETRVGKSESSTFYAQPTSFKMNGDSFSAPTSQSSLSRPSQGSGSAPIPFRVKPEPVEAMIPRKRLSDIGIDVERTASDFIGPSAPKRPRIVLGPDTAAVVHDISIMETRIKEVQADTLNQRRLLAGLYAQSHPVDTNRVEVLNTEISRLNDLELSYKHTLSVARQALPKDHVTYDIREDRTTNILQSDFPMRLDDIERKPLAIGGSVQSSQNKRPDFFPNHYPFLDDTKRKPSIGAQQPTPVASIPASASTAGSWMRSTDGAMNNAIASSSKPLYPSLDDPDLKLNIPGAFESDPYDSKGPEDDFEEAAEIPVDTLVPFVNSLGVHAPPPIADNAHDDNGDYHGRGRDLFIGPQAAADDIEKFLIEAGNAETFDGNESVDKALRYLGMHHLQEKIPGMEIALMAHQAMGVAWMLEKEKSTLLGGCLADEMGLGKTIQMITCMVRNRSPDPAYKTTLIVAPLALLDQWKLEIEEKTNCGFSCLIYHGPSRTKKSTELMKYDIVLTTFNTMAMEWPDYENEMKKKAKARKQKQKNSFIVKDSDGEDMRNAQYRNTKRKQHAGLLFQAKFYRIVADEGQQIRNRRTRMSRAITDLQTKYRWVLTGTPIVNGLSDVYGYIRFLRIRPWYDWTEFHSHIGKLEKKQPAIAVARLQKVMTTFLLRRKKDSKLDGKNLIELPEKKIELCKLEFSQEEREIYSMVELRSQAKFNRYLREGTVLKNYHQVLVLLLRLRQICSHPCLIQEGGVAFVHPDESKVKPEFATELTRARRLVSAEFVEKMKEKFKQDALNRIEAEKQDANATIEEEDCPICYDAMTDAVVTACAHIFCRGCIVDVLNRAPPMDPAEQPAGANADERPCPVCRSAISTEKCFSRDAFEPSDKDLKANLDSDGDVLMGDDDDDTDYSKGKGKGKAAKRSKKSGRASRRMTTDSDEYGEDDDSDDSMSDFIIQNDEDEEEKEVCRAMKKRSAAKRQTHIILDSDDEPDTPEEKEVIFGVRKKVPHETSKDAILLMSRFLPSSKMKYMMDLLQKLAKTNPEEKTLVVSQWTGCLTLVSDYLTENGIPHVKYQGDMNRSKRDQAVKVFMSKEKARVMLMSLKCGGVGLNLTRANNVISLDLGWSQAVESQAYDRVHRLGQTRTVTVQRVVIADTVEDRILALQQRKQALADGSLGEGTGQKIGKLSVKELANLFGLDARGRRLQLLAK